MIIVNIDESQSHYEGVAYLSEDDKTIPSAAVRFRTRDKSSDFNFRTHGILPIDPRTSMTGSWEDVKKNYAVGAVISQFADISGSCGPDSLQFSWVTDTKTTGSSMLPRSRADKASDLVPLNKRWRNTRRMLPRWKRGAICFVDKTNPGACERRSIVRDGQILKGF